MLWLRALIVYPITILLFRFLGRGLQFQTRPYDLAVSVLLGSAAANLIVNQEVELWRAFTSLGVLALLHTGLSFLSLWNPAKKILVGEPAVMVENGTVVQGNLLKFQISVEELMTGLREKGYHNLQDVEMAMLEPSGKLSVVPRSQARPVTPKDLGIGTQYEGITNILVTDGQVDQQSLRKIGLDQSWLLARLAEHGVGGPEEVLFASLDTQGQFLVVRRQDVPFLQAIFRGVQSQTRPGLPPMVAKH